MSLKCDGGCGAEVGVTQRSPWAKVAISGLDEKRDRTLGPEVKRFCPDCWARIKAEMVRAAPASFQA